MSTEALPRRLYRLAPIDRTGVLLGLSLPQVILGGTTLTAGAIVMATFSTIVGLLICVLGAVTALARHNGDAVLHQLPHALRYARRVHNDTTSLASLPVLGPSPRPTKGHRARRPARRPASRTARRTTLHALAAQQLHHVDPSEFGVSKDELRGPVAVVVDHRHGLYAVTIRIAGRQFGLLEGHAQDWQLAQWGNILGQFVSERPTICQIQWSEWAAPSGIAEHRDWLEATKSSQPLPDALAAWELLLAHSGPIATRHEVLLTITAHTSRIRIQHRHVSRHAATLEVLLKETRALLLRLNGAGLHTAVLTPREHNRAMRLRLDPSVRATLDRREAFLGTASGYVSDDNARPLATKDSWSYLAADNAVHRCFVVAEWPRLDVPGDWMRTLLMWSGAVRSVTVFFQPVSRSKSQRAITAQATKIEADVAHRHQKGHRSGAAHRRAAAAVNEREEELVAGYVELGFAGLVNITASSLHELDQASTDITQIAAGIGVELRPLHGRHGDALAACLPVPRGIRYALL